MLAKMRLSELALATHMDAEMVTCDTQYVVSHRQTDLSAIIHSVKLKARGSHFVSVFSETNEPQQINYENCTSTWHPYFLLHLLCESLASIALQVMSGVSGLRQARVSRRRALLTNELGRFDQRGVRSQGGHDLIDGEAKLGEDDDSCGLRVVIEEVFSDNLGRKDPQEKNHKDCSHKLAPVKLTSQLSSNDEIQKEETIF